MYFFILKYQLLLPKYPTNNMGIHYVRRWGIENGFLGGINEKNQKKFIFFGVKPPYHPGNMGGTRFYQRFLKINFSAFDWYQKSGGMFEKKWRKTKLKKKIPQNFAKFLFFVLAISQKNMGRFGPDFACVYSTIICIGKFK